MVLPGQGGITAILGPTNTGKTHRAVERMLQFRTIRLWVTLTTAGATASNTAIVLVSSGVQGGAATSASKARVRIMAVGRC